MQISAGPKTIRGGQKHEDIMSKTFENSNGNLLDSLSIPNQSPSDKFNGLKSTRPSVGHIQKTEMAFGTKKPGPLPSTRNSTTSKQPQFPKAPATTKNQGAAGKVGFTSNRLSDSRHTKSTANLKPIVSPPRKDKV